MFRKLPSRPDWRTAAVVTAALRIFYTALAAAFSPFLHPKLAAIRSNQLTDNLPAPHGLHYALLDIWDRFDTLWFLRIAEHGYDRPMAVIFYPLYPASIRLVSLLMPAIAAALLVSTLATFFLFWGILRMAADRPDPERLRIVLLLAMWPTSFVLFAGYADSLTIALVLWAVVFARQARWESATVCGFLAGVSRPTGVLVFVPLAVIAIRSRQVRSLVVALTPLGLIGYWGWLRWSGRIRVVDAYRLYQGMTMAPPWRSAEEVWQLIVVQHDVVLAIKVGLVIAAVIVSLRPGTRMRIEDRVFVWAVCLQMFMYTGRPLLGGLRYMLMMYPVFLTAGAYSEGSNKRRFWFCLSSLAFLNLIWMWAFLNWSLVF